MASLTPLQETYCRWDSTPPHQADVLEGLAQLVTVNLLGIHDTMQMIHREVLLKTLGFTQEQSNRILEKPLVQTLFHHGYSFAQNYGTHILAPALRHINFRFPKLQEKTMSPAMHYLVGAINGVMGNYLRSHHNPIALPMVFYDHYGQLQSGDLKGRVVILVHGLCMNHLTWAKGSHAGIGEHLLAQRDNNTIIYLNYNTGRRISANGKTFARQIEDLLQRNPEITSIDLIGHSMGGLVSRSALFYGKQNVHHWVNKVGNLVCIGSPHHGAVLERLGFMLQDRLGRFPILNRIGRLTQIRSDGILDLRYGSVRDDDWEHLEVRTGTLTDVRKTAPLPSRINSFLVAGTIETKPKQSKALEVVGDYLVSVSSALGEHPNPKYQLNVPEPHKAVFYGLNHMEIQYHSQVAEQITRWFYPENLSESSHRIENLTQADHEHVQSKEMYEMAGIVET